jgi:hypothetical protein
VLDGLQAEAAASGVDIGAGEAGPIELLTPADASGEEQPTA